MHALLKAKLKYKHLFKLEFEDGHHAVFRLLTWGEFKAVRDTLVTAPELEYSTYESVFEMAVLKYKDPFVEYFSSSFVEEIEHSPQRPDLYTLLGIIDAGVLYTTVEAILRLSGAMNPEQFFRDLEISRYTQMSSFEDVIQHTTANVFHVDPLSLDRQYWIDVLAKISNSENFLVGNFPNPPFSLAEPEEDGINFDRENMEDDSI